MNPRNVTSATKRNRVLPTSRQIRFISSEGPPHAKRRRISAACLTCRKRKTRCSGEKPACNTCTNNGHDCAGYTAPRNLSRTDVASNVEENEYKEANDHDETDRIVETGVSQSVQAGNGPAEIHSHSVEPKGTTRSTKPPLPNDGHISPLPISPVRRRVPFFRYFGPTAIVPGFKQMVVQVKDRHHRRHIDSHARRSDNPLPDLPRIAQHQSYHDPVFYDPTDTAPVPDVIDKLCEAFFDNLGDQYPFLPRQRFLKDLKAKKVDATLVDAVCAIAARFCSDKGLTRPYDASAPLNENGEIKRAFRGQPYAQRALHAVIDTFGCPTISVAQACLLLAYEEFGTDRDSGLWMLLGTAIRMAQDLGIQKLEGLHLEGLMGPTPKTVKQGEYGVQEEARRAEEQAKRVQALIERTGKVGLDDRRVSENERIDTFWAIFFLDRAVSSGVGRPVTLRDKAIEISFPWRPDETMINGYPHPYPVMMRIIHLYGRIADVLNNIKHFEQITPEVLQRLTSMEKDLTGIYQGFSQKLYFNATNFQHYVKQGQGTNFILLHFWFHTSIILLHLPTILHSFEGPIQQLFPESRELSMSSAKTIADIVSFAELIDLKSFIGNPFTSQPVYIAACAFLAESRVHASQPGSRQTSPPLVDKEHASENKLRPIRTKPANKHTLLATVANQNYQRCYKALKLLNSYWAGCRYILTALDQKSKGLLDPILFTEADIDGEMPSSELSFTVPGWRASPHHVPSSTRTATSAIDWNHAIGWSLSGNTNSSTANLAILHPNHDSRATLDRCEPPGKTTEISPGVREISQNGIPSSQFGARPAPDNVRSTEVADLRMNVPSSHGPASRQQVPALSVTNLDFMSPEAALPHGRLRESFLPLPTVPQQHSTYADMLVASQDVDMSHPFTDIDFDGFDIQEEMVPWLEYLPQDIMSYFTPAEYAQDVTEQYGQSQLGQPIDQVQNYGQHDFTNNNSNL